MIREKKELSKNLEVDGEIPKSIFKIKEDDIRGVFASLKSSIISTLIMAMVTKKETNKLFRDIEYTTEEHIELFKSLSKKYDKAE